jgi:ATP-binding cassette, subfamily G (WHITE), member 2, PDR
MSQRRYPPNPSEVAQPGMPHTAHQLGPIEENIDETSSTLVSPNPNRQSKTDSTDTAGDLLKDEIGEENEDIIVDVARSISRVSQEFSRVSRDFASRGVNTFLDPGSRPDLDPQSSNFNSRRWVKNMLDVCARDPDRYPRRSAGVSFRNLNVFGYGSAVDYQTTVSNMWLKGVGWLQGVLGSGKNVRIDILRNFEGFVRSGEMLVVLGRPGRYVKPLATNYQS